MCDDIRENKILAAKKRKIDDEGRAYNREWCSKYLVVPHSQCVVCVVCQNTIAAMKEYSAKRNYTTKLSFQLDEIFAQTRLKKIQHLKNPLKNSNVFLPVHEKFRIGYKT